MKIVTLSSESYTTTSWSGGSTTELMIYPETSCFNNRDFNVRISSATVEEKYTQYTPLPHIHRILMVLKGELTLRHEGHHSVHLLPFNIDRFDGNWLTHSEGKVTNFNVMYMGDDIPELHHWRLNSPSTIDFPLGKSCFAFFYVVHGNLLYKNGESSFTLTPSAGMYISAPDSSSPGEFIPDGDVDLIGCFY